MRAVRAFEVLKRNLWSRPEITLKTKIRIFNAVVLPVLTYGATTWALTQTEEKKLDAFEMRLLRRMLNIRWDDFVRNDDIRRRLNQIPVSIKIKKGRLKWFGHVERMDEGRGPRRALGAEMHGRRPLGRPRTRWLDVLARDLEGTVDNLEEAREAAQDRGRWREIVSALCHMPVAGR